jgi:hypothetical protein
MCIVNVFEALYPAPAESRVPDFASETLCTYFGEIDRVDINSKMLIAGILI